MPPLPGSHRTGLLPPEHRGGASIWQATVSSRGGKISYNLVTEEDRRVLGSRIAPPGQEGLLQAAEGQGWRTAAGHGHRRDTQEWGDTAWLRHRGQYPQHDGNGQTSLTQIQTTEIKWLLKAPSCQPPNLAAFLPIMPLVLLEGVYGHLGCQT